jgi:hypothetical protein
MEITAGMLRAFSRDLALRSNTIISVKTGRFLFRKDVDGDCPGI